MSKFFDPSFTVGDIIIGKDDQSIFIAQILAIHQEEYELHMLYDSSPVEYMGTMTLSFNHPLHFPLRIVSPDELELFRLLHK